MIKLVFDVIGKTRWMINALNPIIIITIINIYKYQAVGIKLGSRLGLQLNLDQTNLENRLKKQQPTIIN